MNYRKGQMAQGYPVPGQAVRGGDVATAGGGPQQQQPYVQPPQFVRPDGFQGYNNYPASYNYCPQHSDERRRKNSFANALAALFVCCWCITWPCHGPCCCGF
ncbi:unnamed protein product [Sphagnum balticum]